MDLAAKLLTTFLATMKFNFIAAKERHCPLVATMESLAKISHDEMKETIRLTIFKMVMTLEDLIENKTR